MDQVIRRGPPAGGLNKDDTTWVSINHTVVTNASTFRGRELCIGDKLVQFGIQLAKGACELGGDAGRGLEGCAGNIEDALVELGHQVDDLAPDADLNPTGKPIRDTTCQCPSAIWRSHN